MAAFTSKATGNWSSSGQTTWNEVGVPGNGDTVTTSAGHTITVDVNTTYGASGAAGSVAGTFSGPLAVAAGIVFTVRGDTVLNNTTLTLGGGSSYVFDSSLAAGTPVYRIVFGTTTGQASNKLICSGTSGSRVTVGKAASSGNGQIVIRADASANHGQIDAAYTDFSDLGGSSTGFSNYGMELSAPNSGQVISFDNCTWSRCGLLYVPACGAAANLSITHCSLSGSTYGSKYTWWLTTTAATTGTRAITDSNLSDRDYAIIFDASIGGYTLARNMLSVVTYSAGTTGSMTSCVDNMIYERTSPGASAHLGWSGGTVQDSYVAADMSVEGCGLDFPTIGATGTYTHDGTIYESSVATEGSDCSHIPSPSAAMTLQLIRVIVLPNSRGGESGNIPAHGNANTTVRVEHCTLMAGNFVGSSTGEGAVYSGSTYAGFAGMYPAVRDNIVWNKTLPTGDGYVCYRAINLGPADVFTTSGLDYNGKFNVQNGTVYDSSGANGLTKNGYHQLWQTSQAVGAHDVVLTGANETSGGPKFVDSTRNLATFDTAYLGNSASAWADATSYAVGDIRSAATSSFYNNATINYRCVTAHTSNAANATNGKPGSAASYRTNWEFASAYRIRTGLIAGTTTGGLNWIKALHDWVKAGFAPQEAALKNADHTGAGDIGAVAVASAAGGVWPFFADQSHSGGFWDGGY